MTISAAQRRYNYTVLTLSACYAALLLGAVALFKYYPLAGPAAYCVAIMPALPLIAMFVATGRYLISERDEYLRMLMIRQTLIASAFGLSIFTAWGFLASFNFAPHVDAYSVPALWYGGLGLGALFNKVASRGGA